MDKKKPKLKQYSIDKLTGKTIKRPKPPKKYNSPLLKSKQNVIGVRG